LQLAFFCLSALAHGTAFVRWKRWTEDEKERGWVLYGWFTGLSFCGSTTGAFAYWCRLRQLELFYFYSHLENTNSRIYLETLVGPTPAQEQHLEILRRDSRRWVAAHFALFPFELGCVVLAQLLVLRRMQHFAVSRSAHPERWRWARRGLLTVVVFLIALGICGNFGAAFYFNQAADFHADSANAFAFNDTTAGKAYSLKATQRVGHAYEVSSVQRFSEVSLLMLIIAAFSTVGFFSAQVIASALRTLFTAQQRLGFMAGVAGEQGRQMVSDASLQGRQLQRKVLGTFVFVFATLLLRSVFSVIYAVAQALQNYGNPCALSFCDTCKNHYANILGWIIYTPPFQLVTVLIASPISLLIALWGMSGVRALEQMTSNRVQLQLGNIGGGTATTFAKRGAL
jgi:hypothetical protein